MNEKSESIDSTKVVMLQFRYALLTYKTHIDKEQYKNHISSVYSNIFLSIAHETGESTETPYDHTHVVIDLGRRVTVRNVRKFDFIGIHPNIKALGQNRKSYIDAINYILKEDKGVCLPPDYKENTHPDTCTPLSELVWSCTTKQEALVKYVKKPSDASGILTIWSNRPRYTNPGYETLLPWQNDLYEIIHQAKPRQIYIIYDPAGNSGKTEFCRYMLNKHPNDTRCIKTVSSQQNMANDLYHAHEDGNTLKYVLFDISRSCHVDDGFYTICEDLRDRTLSNTKYCSKTFDVQNDVVVIFTNHHIVYSKWTSDRPQLYHLNSGILTGPHSIKPQYLHSLTDEEILA